MSKTSSVSVCFYKRFFFFEKHLENVKLSFTNIFQKLYFDLLALKVSKIFLCLLAFIFYYLFAGFALLLKAYKTLISCLFRSL